MLILPTELRDEVIDILRDDFDALEACSLTCRELAPRARRHLFWTVHVGPDSYERLMDILTQPQTKTPSIGPLVQHLLVTAYRRSSGNGPEVWTHDALEKLVRKMPTMVRLSLHALEMGHIDWSKIGSCLPKLELLNLHSVQIHEPDTIPKLFEAFPSLHGVECDCVYNSGRPDSGEFRPLAEGTMPASLAKLNVKEQYLPGDPFARRLVKWLLAHNLHKKLRVLQIDGLDAPLLELFCKLVSDIGPDLRTLGISFDKALSFSVEGPTELVSALKRCTSLQTFELLWLTLNDPQPWVCALFESIPPAELRWVEARLRAGGGFATADYDNVDFAGMASVLAEFPKLRRVALQVSVVHLKEVGPPLRSHILKSTAPLGDRVAVRVS